MYEASPILCNLNNKPKTQEQHSNWVGTSSHARQNYHSPYVKKAGMSRSAFIQDNIHFLINQGDFKSFPKTNTMLKDVLANHFSYQNLITQWNFFVVVNVQIASAWIVWTQSWIGLLNHQNTSRNHKTFWETDINTYCKIIETMLEIKNK